MEPFQPLLNDLQNLIHIETKSTSISKEEEAKRCIFCFSVPYLDHPVTASKRILDFHFKEEGSRTPNMQGFCECKYGHYLNGIPYDIVQYLDSDFPIGLNQNDHIETVLQRLFAERELRVSYEKVCAYAKTIRDLHGEHYFSKHPPISIDQAETEKRKPVFVPLTTKKTKVKEAANPPKVKKSPEKKPHDSTKKTEGTKQASQSQQSGMKNQSGMEEYREKQRQEFLLKQKEQEKKTKVIEEIRKALMTSRGFVIDFKMLRAFDIDVGNDDTECMLFFLSFNEGGLVGLQMLPTNTVETLRKVIDRVQDKKNYHIVKSINEYQGTPLKDASTLEEAGVKDGEILHIMSKKSAMSRETDLDNLLERLKRQNGEGSYWDL